MNEGDQRAKLDGPPPEPPSSPEQNIARGTKAIARVLATGQADMAAMHRKDLGWIAFEPGVVSLTPKGEVKGAGLRKIQRKHAESLAHLPQAIAKGKLHFVRKRRRRRSAELRTDDAIVSMRLDKDGDRQTWVITGYRTE